MLCIYKQDRLQSSPLNQHANISVNLLYTGQSDEVCSLAYNCGGKNKKQKNNLHGEGFHDE